MLEHVRASNDKEWLCEATEKKLKAQQKAAAAREKHTDTGYIDPGYLLSMLADFLPEEAVVTTEVGQNQIWTANNYKVRMPGTFITSGGWEQWDMGCLQQ
jgi:acetolactate synthase-1/2/3 large subunit